jgi:hypothetical protein
MKYVILNLISMIQTVLILYHGRLIESKMQKQVMRRLNTLELILTVITLTRPSWSTIIILNYFIQLFIFFFASEDAVNTLLTTAFRTNCESSV